MATGLAGIDLGPKINWDSGPELYNKYRKWKQIVQTIFDGPLNETSEEIKCKYLLIWSGDFGLDLYNSWGFSETESKKLVNYWKKFEEYVNPQANFLIARHKLRLLEQKDKSLEEFLTEIRLTVNDCGYQDSNFRDEMIRDTLVFGIRNDQVRFKCISKGNELTLQKAIEIARNEVATGIHVKELDNTQEVHSVRKSRYPQRNQRSSSKFNASHNHTQTHNPVSPPQQKNSKYQDMKKKSSYTKQSCYFCGRPGKHKRDKCPAKDSKCHKCLKQGHFASVCRSSHSAVHEVDKEFDNLFVGSVETEPVESIDKPEIIREFSVTIKPYHRIYSRLLCKLDTGAATNVLPLDTYSKLFPDSHKLEKATTKLTAYGGKEIQCYGTCTLYLRHRGSKHSVKFNVTDKGGVMLGYPTCKALDLIRVNCEIQTNTKLKPNKGLTKKQVLEDYSDVFSGIGCFPGKPYHIQLKEDSVPVVNPPRSVSIHLQDAFRKELERMESLGIISKVTQPTEWVNSFVIVDKGGGKGIRVCLDPRDINKNIKREHYYTRKIDDITPKMTGCTHFTVVDARSGYWMVALDEESSLLTTFSTPFGRFKYNRLPFGIVVAQDIFQRKMDSLFGDLPGVTGIADDLFVMGTSEENHDRNFINLLKHAGDNNIKFNSEKLQFKVKEAKFFGHVWTPEGIKPSPDKVEAITNMNPPKSVSDLQSFLGLVNYLNRFNPTIATLASPLRELTKKDVTFLWNPEHQAAFDRIKEVIASPTTLSYFDPSKDTIIQSDASLQGLGAVLLQDEKPVCYASRTLTECEKNYSNIERELLAAVWSLEKFNHYVYGKAVKLQTDHKPIVAASKKQISKTSPRLQRLLLRMSKYDVDLEYLPGKQNVIADALSRVDPSHSNCKKENYTEIPEIPVNLITNTVDTKKSDIDRIRENTAMDLNLQMLKKFIIDGWPDLRSNCPPEVIDYWNYREDLSIEDGVIFKCNRIVIPEILRKEMLSLIHQGHMGIEKCLLRAKQSVFWPRVSCEIKQIVSQCGICQQHQRQQSSEPLIPHDLAQYPWQKLGSDLFQYNRHVYLLVVDYYSKFPVVRRLGTTPDSNTIIVHLKSIFCEYGIPEEFISDNGPQYDCRKFKDFCTFYNIHHTTSSPTYAQSNGMAERFVQTVKKLILKTLEAGEDANLALLNYRSTPISHTLPSPAQLLMSRNIKTLLPMSKSLLKSKSPDNDLIKEELYERQKKQKKFYDRKAFCDLPTLQQGQSVRIYNPKVKNWVPATVVTKTNDPRSYYVKSENGIVYRRNRKHLRTTGEKFEHSPHAKFDMTNMDDPDDNQDDMNNNPDPLSVETRPSSKTRSGREVRAPQRLIEHI